MSLFSHDKNRAARWRQFMDGQCWKELEQMMDEIVKTATRDEDAIPTRELTVGIVAESRGVREGIRRIRMMINDIL